ncbi:hypothetical protein V1478_004585 [Vespula squamosa]|uniref:Uncharacterized protein n=1 Tax=Vespula squamosa TaxID=30214 RepID=A0ABD2BGK9_VESSQ
MGFVGTPQRLVVDVKPEKTMTYLVRPCQTQVENLAGNQQFKPIFDDSHDGEGHGRGKGGGSRHDSRLDSLFSSGISCEALSLDRRISTNVSKYGNSAIWNNANVHSKCFEPLNSLIAGELQELQNENGNDFEEKRKKKERKKRKTKFVRTNRHGFGDNTFLTTGRKNDRVYVFDGLKKLEAFIGEEFERSKIVEGCQTNELNNLNEMAAGVEGGERGRERGRERNTFVQYPKRSIRYKFGRSKSQLTTLNWHDPSQVWYVIWISALWRRNNGFAAFTGDENIPYLRKANALVSIRHPLVNNRHLSSSLTAGSK